MKDLGEETHFLKEAGFLSKPLLPPRTFTARTAVCIAKFDCFAIGGTGGEILFIVEIIFYLDRFVLLQSIILRFLARKETKGYEKISVGASVWVRRLF